MIIVCKNSMEICNTIIMKFLLNLIYLCTWTIVQNSRTLLFNIANYFI